MGNREGRRVVGEEKWLKGTELRIECYAVLLLMKEGGHTWTNGGMNQPSLAIGRRWRLVPP